MNAFNIHVPYAGEQVTLTILPVDAGYQVIYFGKIAALLQAATAGWTTVPLDQASLGDLPLYDADAFPEHKHFTLDKKLIAAIGLQIEAHLQTSEL